MGAREGELGTGDWKGCGREGSSEHGREGASGTKTKTEGARVAVGERSSERLA